MIAEGANVGAADKAGMTPLHMACQQAQVAAAAALIDAGDLLNAQDAHGNGPCGGLSSRSSKAAQNSSNFFSMQALIPTPSTFQDRRLGAWRSDGWSRRRRTVRLIKAREQKCR